MNVQELIDALNEQWEKKIEDIKSEIKNCKNKFFKNEDGTLSPYMNGTIDRVLEIIDKRISDKE